MERTRDFRLFMTPEDEKMFCEALREFNPNIYFLDTTPSIDCNIDIRLVDDVTKIDSRFYSIVNFDLIDKQKLSLRYKKYSDYYHFSMTGLAQMQFLRSRPDIYHEDCLQHGRIADSYDPGNGVEKKWKNKVYSILKKLGERIFWYYKLPDGTFEISAKPEGQIVALPNAAKSYNGKNGNFMIQHAAKYVPYGITVDDLR